MVKQRGDCVHISVSMRPVENGKTGGNRNKKNTRNHESSAALTAQTLHPSSS